MLNPSFRANVLQIKRRRNEKQGRVTGGVTNRLRQVIDKHRTQYRCQSKNPAKTTIQKGGTKYKSLQP